MIRTHASRHLLESLAYHRDVQAAKLDSPEPMTPSETHAARCWRDALSFAIEIVRMELPDVERESAEPPVEVASGWDTGEVAA